MNTVEPTRPSLVAGNGRTSNGSNAGRILADIDGAERTGTPPAARRWPLWILLLAIAVLVIFAFRWFSSAFIAGSGGATPAGDATFQQTPSSAQGLITAAPSATDVDPEPGSRSAALIVDEHAGAAATVAGDNDPFSMIADASPAGAAATTAGASPDTAAATAATASTATPQRRGSGTARPTAAAPNQSSDLLNSLLDLIRQDGSAEPQHESMDALVERIRAENELTETKTHSTLASLGGPEPAQPQERPSRRTLRVQQELAGCPAANTLDGIACRDRICARNAGKTPLCPQR